MLFHEAIFIFLFLPIVLPAYFLCRLYLEKNSSILLLSVSSIIFYGYWDVKYVPLLFLSIIFNYFIGQNLIKRLDKNNIILFFGVFTNLSLLIFYKYSSMIIDNYNIFFGFNFTLNYPDLPLGISFFTFLQIAYIVDCSKGKVTKTSFSSYFLFVSFFPHLIAGPLVHHKDLIPQFSLKYKKIAENISVGLIIFGIGLFKKLVLSEYVSVASDNMFNGVDNGIMPSFVDAWIGVLSFTLLIYFDFSAYSDMAIGLSKMLGIRLPENFNSPYKSKNIIEFWRRWHITLSQFLKNYLYIPLGGNRHGDLKKYLNILIVMTLAGLWHGAGWTFVLWGSIHGFLLLINHYWQKKNIFTINHFISFWLTFISIMIAWVPFRSSSIESTINVYKGMFGQFGFILPEHYNQIFPHSFTEILLKLGVEFAYLNGFGGKNQIIILILLLLFVMKLPNTQEIFQKYKPTLNTNTKNHPTLLRWEPNLQNAIILGMIFSYLLILVIQGKSGEFIYFQF